MIQKLLLILDRDLAYFIQLSLTTECCFNAVLSFTVCYAVLSALRPESISNIKKYISMYFFFS